ncbi:dihydroorotase [Candidatus Pseudothioglobus sp. Uisw_086]|uniref:dihydroorotase n=1 Tax=Candidatus Pseudothioglobus sp. Uisw_086 TaxID=3230998 RepID=UPI003A8C4A94
MEKVILTKPDDWHLHLRDGEAMKSVVRMSAFQMGRAVIMPNLSPPITNTKQAIKYHNEIVRALPKESRFRPLMVLYLTDKTTKNEIIEASEAQEVHAVKLYPAGATTNSDSGVTNLSSTYPALEQMQKEGVPLLIHGEVTDNDIDVFDREKVFIDRTLTKLVQEFPSLKIVLEHITTKDAVDFVSECEKNIAATITPHHLLANRNHMLVGGIKPHYYCLPVLKRKSPHQEALIAAATSGSPKFFLGTDSAPHEKHQKESSCGCAGVFSAHAAVELYAEAFDGAGKIEKLEGFASFFGADFYGLPRNQEKITLEKTTWRIPESYNFSGSHVVPFFAGEELSWRLSA